ncbi:MAG: hypothetical protein QME81_00515 [bacterium]|nr:hypothetical protein [bacterium]
MRRYKIADYARVEYTSPIFPVPHLSQKQREFEEARRNYQKALEIFIEFNDQYHLEIVARSLKRLEEEE